MTSFPDPLLALLIASGATLLGLALFAPGRGLLARARRARKISARVMLEDALKHIQRCESHGQIAGLHSLAGALGIPTDQAAGLLSKLQAHELVRMEREEYRLTPAGREYALRVIRAHRLWEQYLAEETGVAEAEWHGQAEQYEHQLTPDEATVLSRQLGHPLYDPHGDPIPDQAGEFKPHAGQPLTSMPVDVPLRIVHIEDEPETVYAQLAAEGLIPGMEVRLIEVSPQRVRFWADSEDYQGSEEHLLAPVVAANISVVPLPEGARREETAGVPLDTLKRGERGRVVALSPRLRGAERRRLLDLGILPGTPIEVELTSPGGDPTAYRVREALIALRREQARLIHMIPYA
jgi:DtxR family Mn-dependent transcriptional regulator